MKNLRLTKKQFEVLFEFLGKVGQNAHTDYPVIETLTGVENKFLEEVYVKMEKFKEWKITISKNQSRLS